MKVCPTCGAIKQSIGLRVSVVIEYGEKEDSDYLESRCGNRIKEIKEIDSDMLCSLSEQAKKHGGFDV